MKINCHSTHLATVSSSLTKFTWNDVLWQFTSLHQGFSLSPRFFTKLLKVPFSHFRALGIVTTIYIDDCLVMAPSKEKLIDDVAYIASTLDELDFMINPLPAVDLYTDVSKVGLFVGMSMYRHLLLFDHTKL